MYMCNEKELIKLINAFCYKYLDEEYKNLSVKLIKRMANEEKVLFNCGSLENWAHEGQYVSRKTLLRFYHAKSSTITNKSAEIKKKYNLDSREYYTSTTLEYNLRLNRRRNTAIIQNMVKLFK